MATQDDVRRIALALPEVVEETGHFAFSVLVDGKSKGFVWIWMERVAADAPRVARPDVVAVRVADLDDKQALLTAEPSKFFTEAHYNGFPAVLVRLEAIDEGEMTGLVVEAWRSQAPPALVREFDLRTSLLRQ
jgi:hypothetical protein